MAIRVTFHSSIVSTVKSDDFNTSDENLETLVKTKVKAGLVDEGIGDTYVGVLVRRTQLEFVKPEYSADTDGMLSALDVVGKGMMKVVNRAVITPDIKANPKDSSEEKKRKTTARQSRTSFARSAKAAVSRWIKAGGNIEEVDPACAKKSVFEKTAKQWEAEAAESAGENTPEAKVAKRLAGLITALNQIADEPARRRAAAHACTAIGDGVK